MKRVEFRLCMPGRGSWDGGWSGDGRNYAIVRRLTDNAAKTLGLVGLASNQSWCHHWEDGWTAQVTARVVPAGERLKKSAGFCGYDWMVTNILHHGNTKNGEVQATGADKAD